MKRAQAQANIVKRRWIDWYVYKHGDYSTCSIKQVNQLLNFIDRKVRGRDVARCQGQILITDHPLSIVILRLDKRPLGRKTAGGIYGFGQTYYYAACSGSTLATQTQKL